MRTCAFIFMLPLFFTSFTKNEAFCMPKTEMMFCCTPAVTLPEMLEKMEECYSKRKQMRSFKSNDLKMLYVFFCVTGHKFASEKRGMPKLR